MSRATHSSASTAVVLDAVRAAGTISRVGLTETTGLTGATVSTVVRSLIDSGLVVESGRAESTGGKPRVLLRLDPTARFAVGVHLDHAALTYVVTDLVGAPVARMTRPGPGGQEPSVVLRRVAHDVGALVDSVGVDPAKVLGIGLVSPGPLTSAHGMSRTPPFMRPWLDYPIIAELSALTTLPVLLENDATASAIGEHWSGGGAPERSFATLYMGTGLGAGILLDGIAYQGVSGNAGEIGHTSLDLDGPVCWCGMRGCVEVLAGPAAVVASVRADDALRAEIGLAPEPGTASTQTELQKIARASRNGVIGAQERLERSARFLAVAAHTVANLLDLRLIVLTGSSFAAASHVYVPAIRDVLARSFFARTSHPVEVRLSRTASTGPAVGGAALALQSLLVPTATVAAGQQASPPQTRSTPTTSPRSHR